MRFKACTIAISCVDADVLTPDKLIKMSKLQVQKLQ